MSEYDNDGRTNVVMCWSGGKNSAFALWRLLTHRSFRVTGLLTTFTEGLDRVSGQMVPRVLVEAQAEAIGIPLFRLWLPHNCPERVYEHRFMEGLDQLKARGAQAVAFGDIWVEHERLYREDLANAVEMEPLFPIWGEHTMVAARTIVHSGFNATIVNVNTRMIPAAVIGQSYNDTFLRNLHRDTDPCGEKGEFHTFVHDGPIFHHPVHTLKGNVREWGGHLLQELLPFAQPGLLEG